MEYFEKVAIAVNVGAALLIGVFAFFSWLWSMWFATDKLPLEGRVRLAIRTLVEAQRLMLKYVDGCDHRSIARFREKRCKDI